MNLSFDSSSVNSSQEWPIGGELNSTSLRHHATQYEALYKDLTIFGLYSLTVVIALFGNLIVCYVCFVQRQRRKIFYLLIGNMAVSDLLSAILIPLQWVFCSTHFLDANERFCGSFKSLQVVSYFISTFTTAVISIDRYTILKNPLSRRAQPFFSIGVIWSLSILVGSPTLVAMRVSEYFTPNKLVHCRIILKLDSNITGLIRKYRVAMIVTTQYFIPVVIASIFYSKCIRQIMSRQRIGEYTNQQERNFYRSKLRTIKMLIISLAAFAIAWFPVHVVHVVDFYIYPLMPRQCNSSFTYNLFYWAAISSICWNPFIYNFYDRKFHSAARKFCCCLFLRYSSGKWQINKQPSTGESTRVRCLSDVSSSNVPTA